MFQIPTNIRPTGFPPVSETLPLAVEKIAKALNPEKIILFGSYACGNPTPDSDVDLLIILDTTAKRTERFLSVTRLLRPRQFPVDIIIKTPEEIEQEVRTNFFIREIVNKGQVLYER